MAESKSHSKEVLHLGFYRILVSAFYRTGIYRCFCSPDTCEINLFSLY